MSVGLRLGVSDPSDQIGAPIGDLTIRAFLEALGSKAPTPGGGASAGLGAAIGAAQARMVLNFTLGKEKYEAHEAENRERLDRLTELEAEALDACDRDARAYAALNALWGLDKDDPERIAAWDGAVRGAIDAPRSLLSTCAGIAKILGACCGETNRMLRSDLGVSAAIVRGAARGASWNIRINIPLLEEAERARIGSETRDELSEIERICTRVEEECA